MTSRKLLSITALSLFCMTTTSCSLVNKVNECNQFVKTAEGYAKRGEEFEQKLEKEIAAFRQKTEHLDPEGDFQIKGQEFEKLLKFMDAEVNPFLKQTNNVINSLEFRDKQLDKLQREYSSLVNRMQVDFQMAIDSGQKFVTLLKAMPDKNSNVKNINFFERDRQRDQLAKAALEMKGQFDALEISKEEDKLIARINGYCSY